MDYPELAARTRRFTYGAPRAVTVSADGARVVFLRSSGPEDPSDALWIFDVRSGTERLIVDPAALLAEADADLPVEERALRERLRLSASGIGSYALDNVGRVAVFTLGGRLFRTDWTPRRPPNWPPPDRPSTPDRIRPGSGSRTSPTAPCT